MCCVVERVSCTRVSLMRAVTLGTGPASAHAVLWWPALCCLNTPSRLGFYIHMRLGCGSNSRRETESSSHPQRANWCRQNTCTSRNSKKSNCNFLPSVPGKVQEKDIALTRLSPGNIGIRTQVYRFRVCRANQLHHIAANAQTHPLMTRSDSDRIIFWNDLSTRTLKLITRLGSMESRRRQ